MNCRDLCREYIKRPHGAAPREIPGHFKTVGSALWALAQQGEAFAATISHKTVRYFDTQARANAYVLFARKPNLAKAKPKSRPQWPADAPMVFTENTVYTVAPKPPMPTRSNTYPVF